MDARNPVDRTVDIYLLLVTFSIDLYSWLCLSCYGYVINEGGCYGAKLH